MEKYLTQLLEDLEAAANNPPQAAYIEIPPHLESLLDAAELALVPFKPISEWTRIDPKVFPEMIQLSANQMEKLNQAIFRVLESIHVEIIDIPEKISPERLYDVLTWCWDDPVQYLPSTGFDLELCTGDPYNCPYGELCDCDINPKDIHRFLPPLSLP
ncbi:MAG: hypothetical protein HQ542_03630 [Bacteroidia bacterium]|nr:hypothetical protein [Bacteroidia bacterium]